MKPPFPKNEPARLESLRRCNILDTPPEGTLDSVAQLASYICKTPVALVSLVDEARQWFKARVGFSLEETPRDVSFCAHAILEPNLFVVRDTLQDERFKDNPLVQGESKIRFYAGMPLVTSEGHALGTLCVMDYEPRDLRPHQAKALEALARQVVAQLELRRGHADLTPSLRELEKVEEALREQEAKQRLILENVSEIIYSLEVTSETFHGHLDLVSGQVEQIIGYRPEEFLVDPSLWYELLHPEDVPVVEETTLKILKEKQPAVRIYRLRHKHTGEYRWLEDRLVPLLDEQGNVAKLFGAARDVTEQREAARALRESQRRLATLMSNVPGMVYRCRNDRDWTMEFVSDGCAELTGYKPSALVQNTKVSYADLIHPEDRESVWNQVQEALNRKIPFQLTYRIQTAGGVEKWVWEQGRGVYGPNGELAAIEGIISDITEQRRLEAQFRQAQKMEAIGQLAGGVAHDFNNLLMVIKGYSELLQERLPADSRLRPYCEEVQKAAERAGSITRQLLAFSRKQDLQPTVLNLNSVTSGMEKMLRRLIREDIQLITKLDPALGQVKADPGQIEQVIMNLAVNARDAMPNGGRLLIETQNVELDAGWARWHVDALPGQYVMLATTDTGHGMDAKTLAQVFEPFFTTKPEGKGTGLGLSTVFGIVKQSGGHIWVYSEPGKGTTFKVYLPRLEEDATVLETRDTTEELPRGSETILVAEDMPGVRNLAREYLEGQGYSVLEASNGKQALEVVEKNNKDIQLLLTDMVMPELGGKQLAQRLLAKYPALKVIYMTGYTEDAVGKSSASQEGGAILQKPFARECLLRTVRNVLDGKALQ